MNFLRFLFTLSGRIGRLDYWRLTIKAGLVTIALMVFAILLSRLDRFFFIFVMLVGFAWAVSTAFTISARRCQDFGYDGRIGGTLIIVLSLAGVIAPEDLALVANLPALGVLSALGFIRGTRGWNRYGEDPAAPAPTFPQLTNPEEGKIIEHD